MARIQALPLICITVTIDLINWSKEIAFNKIIEVLKTKALENF